MILCYKRVPINYSKRVQFSYQIMLTKVLRQKRGVKQTKIKKKYFGESSNRTVTIVSEDYLPHGMKRTML